MNSPAERVVQATRHWLGTPYIHQASVRGAGCDCLGLLRGVWRDVEGDEPVSPPAYSSVWNDTGPEESLLEAARRYFIPVEQGVEREGDVLVFRFRNGWLAKHCGILSAKDRFIHAYQPIGVVESSLGHVWRKRIAGIFRFPSTVEDAR